MSQKDTFEPGVYVRKRDSATRRVETKSDAVAAVFEGFVRDDSQAAVAEPDEVTEDDGANGVGTLGTGDAPEGDVTPAGSAPVSIFGGGFSTP